MLEIAREAAEEPERVKQAPTTRPVRRLDEVLAAKRLVLRYAFEAHPDLAAERAATAAAP
jgi:glycine dehydrogenase subunit 2